jgi:hypothetical protein
MGRHRVDSTEPLYRLSPVRHRRRRWPIAAFVAVLLIIGGWFGWSRMHGVMVERAATASGSCPAGNESIQIAVTPAMADAIGHVASDYVRTNPVVMEHCVTVAVSGLDPKAVLTGLTNGWNVDQLGPKPDAWIADSTLWTNQLSANSIGDEPQSVASSPLVLAMPADAAKAVQAAGAPTLASLPGLIAQASGWAKFGEPAWGPFTIALPDPAANAATTLALEAMLDPPTPQGQQPVTATLINSPEIQQDLQNFAAGQPMPATTTSHQALVSLGGADGIAHAPFSAVPVAEVDLYERNLGLDGDVRPLNVLDEVRLAGSTPHLDYPFTPLAGSWVSSDLVAAAENFRNFLLTAPEQTLLARSGFRVPDTSAHPDSAPGMDWGSVAQGTAPTDATSYQQVAAAWQAVTQATH